MKIRNIPFKNLNPKEKWVVREFWKGMIEVREFCGNPFKCNNSVEEFWEEHKEMDTNDGNYNGWIKPIDSLELIMDEKLEQIKEKNEQKRNIRI